MNKTIKHIRTALILGTAALAPGLLQAAPDTPSAAPTAEKKTDSATLIKQMETAYDELKTQLNGIHDRPTADAAAAWLKNAKTAFSAIGASLNQTMLTSGEKQQLLDISGTIARLLTQNQGILKSNEYYGSDELRAVMQSFFTPMKQTASGAYIMP